MKLSMAFSLLLNMKMPTAFMFSCVEHKKSFIISGLGFLCLSDANLEAQRSWKLEGNILPDLTYHAHIGNQFSWYYQPNSCLSNSSVITQNSEFKYISLIHSDAFK